MCGILFILSYDSDEKAIEDSILPLIRRRGPDGYHKYTTSIRTQTQDLIFIEFHGTVLHLRGDLTEQPLVSNEGHVFMWNGEIFGGDVQVGQDDNDTAVLFEKLCQVPFEKEDHHIHFLSLFETIQGPWAFVFYDALNRNIWYGRDYFGRRSLMTGYDKNTFSLSSLGHRTFSERFSEVPAKQLYRINIGTLCKGEVMPIETYDMQTFLSNSSKLLVEHRCLLNDKKYRSGRHNESYCTSHTGTDHNTHNSADEMQSCHEGHPNFYKNKNKINDITGDLNDIKINENETENGLKLDKNVINGGLKCCNCLYLNKVVSPCVNAAAIPDQESSELKDSKEYIEETSNITFICTNCHIPTQSSCNDIMTIENIQYKFLHVLEEAVRKRVYNLPRVVGNETSSMLPKVGILFSGGIDSAVLSSLADRCIPQSESIDLINVAFAQKAKVEQNVKKKQQKKMDSSILRFDVPDRITGRTALKELSKKRRWNFIEVDVTLEELQEWRKSTITNLVYPLDSVLDDSIGCAIWFAARSTGKCYNLCEDGTLQLTHEKYTSPVKVLLTGMGADEQLGGYARHRTKFQSLGWPGLEEEMKMELERISSRNLGRDDRCISDHGREARFPFLDEDVVLFLQRIPVCVKCDPRLPRGFGEKILLREVATSLGLYYASNLPKRAIQFGSKIAKLESSKEKGSDNCKRLENVEIS